MTREPPVRRWNRRLALLVVVVVAADWLTKFIVLNRVALHDRVALIGGWLSVVNTRNEGIAFSLFGGSATAWRLPLLLVVAAVTVVVLIRFVDELQDRTARVGVALIIAGALGNLGDRILDGGVTDFLLLRYFPFIFNVADVAVTMGGILLATTLLRHRRVKPVSS